MLSKQDHIQYWLTGSEEDWQRADWMEERGDFVFALFCTHLSLEKLCKALWVKENNANYPPRIHDLKYLLADTCLLIPVLLPMQLRLYFWTIFKSTR